MSPVSLLNAPASYFASKESCRRISENLWSCEILSRCTILFISIFISSSIFTGKTYCTGKAASPRSPPLLGQFPCARSIIHGFFINILFSRPECLRILWQWTGAFNEDEAIHRFPFWADYDIQRDGWQENSVHLARIPIQIAFPCKLTTRIKQIVTKWSSTLYMPTCFMVYKGQHQNFEDTFKCDAWYHFPDKSGMVKAQTDDHIK